MKVVWVLVAALLLGCGGRRGAGVGRVGDAAAQAGNTGAGGGGPGGSSGTDAAGAVDAAVVAGDGATPLAPDAGRGADLRAPGDGPGTASDLRADVETAADVALTADVGPDLAPDLGLPPLGPDAAAPVTPEFHLTLPLSSSIVTTRTPTIGWTDPGGFFYFIAEVCRDPACNDVIDRTFSSLTTYTTATLPEGVVYWRVKAMLATAIGPITPVAELFVGAQTAHDTSMLAVPDFNRDGVPDLALAAEGGDVVVRLMSAGFTSPVEMRTQTLPGPTRALAYGVDLNSDGFGDLLQARPAGVEVYYGGAGALVRVTTLTGGPGFGSALAGVGDVNGDGFGDVVIGSQLPGGTASASLYLSARTGLRGPTGAPLAGERFGPAADANADGYADLVACSPAAGKAWFHAGKAGGVAPARMLADPRAGGAGTFGHACRGVGDVNGDGFGDVVVTGASTEPQAFLYLGADQGLTSASATLSLGGASASADELQVASAGDVNGDGYADVLITGAGAVRLYAGSQSGLAPGPVTVLSGDYCLAAGLGDLNHDRTTDVVVAPRACDQPVKIFGGSGSGLSVAPIYTAQPGGTATCPAPLLAY